MHNKFLVSVMLMAGVASCVKVVREYSAVGIGPGPVVQALTSSAISAASGGCYAQCPPETKCIEQTGLCQELPCRGRCAENEQCGTDNRCHPRSEGGLVIIRSLENEK
jgi:hypothetical protein